MEAEEPRVEAKLATMTTAEGVKHFCSEVYVDHRYFTSSDWTRSPVKAIADGAALRASALSDWAYREARYEVAELWARAS